MSEGTLLFSHGLKKGLRMDAFIATFSEYKVAWMLVLFVGVLYWAFRSRFRRPPKD